MTWKLTVLLFLLALAFASDEKDEKKAVELRAKELVQQAKDLEKSGQLVEARKRYANSQAFWETKDAEKAIKHIDDEIHKRVKDALKQAHRLYDQGQFKSAGETLENALQLGNSGAILAYDLALCYRRLGDSVTSLGYLDQAILATTDPKRTLKLKQLRTFFITGEQTAASKDIEKDHIANANRLMESIGFEASLDDGVPTILDESADPSAAESKVTKTALVSGAPAAHSHASSKAHRTSSLCLALDRLKGTTTNTPALTFDLANCAEDNDRPQEASELLQHYLKIAPNAADAARVRLRIADLDALLQLPEQKSAQVRNSYSAASRALEERKYDRTLAELRSAAAVAPDFAPTQWRLALLYEALGNVEQALGYFTRYRQIVSDADAQAEADIHMETLDTKRDKYDQEVDTAKDILSDLLNRAMNLTFNDLEDRAALYKQRQRARKQHYQGKKQLRQVGGFPIPFAYAQQQLAEARDHLATALGLFPLGAEANELMALVFLQANDGRSAMRSFDAVVSQNLPVSFYAELRGHKKDHAVKCELTRDRLQLILLSSYDKKAKPIPPDKPAGEDGLGDLAIDPSSSRKTDFDSLTLTPADIKKVETKNGQLLLKLAREDITLSPVYMPAFTPTEGPAGRRFANNYTRLFVRYPGLEDSKLGHEGLTVHEQLKLAYHIADAGLEIATSLNPMGAMGALEAFTEITKELHATAKALHVSFASWEKAIEDQDEFQNGRTFKMLLVESASLNFSEGIN